MMTNEARRGVEPGATMVTAMLSPVAGGLIRTWTDLGSQLWSVEDPDGLSGILGRGIVGRTPRQDDRFREAAFLNANTGTLVVQNRFVATASGESMQVEANVFQLGDPVRPESNPWRDLEGFLSAAAMSAADRGEYFVAELGGWEEMPEPYCLFAVLDRGDGPVSLIEAAPAPRGTGVWPDVPEGRPGASVTAPATAQSLPGSGIFVASAISTWGAQPWDVALTFGKLGG
ncbi:hypothetical protein [Rhodococcus sp. (in: high G+C Gram-positive bacteria)]|uniref:hypothetical protein n=1 Tax=Rhodococcus TaxID=1827 RepID=UPI00257DB5B8|nr:hypothetical protein [Rhodococcus sp. (in: high G+C Gram-positive bacteria)]